MEDRRTIRLSRGPALALALSLAACASGSSSDAGLDLRPVNPGCIAGARPGGVTGLGLAPAFPNLAFNAPVAMAQAPGDGSRWYLLEKDGRLYVFDNVASASVRTLVADLSARVDARSEGGLLGIAFHPQYGENGHVYLSYTTSDDAVADNGANFRSVIARFTLAVGGTALDAASERPVLIVPQPFGNHNGGQIGFGPDGYLYIGLGDGGAGGDPLGHGQNPRTLLGAMLRVDVDVTDAEYAAGTRYKIPPDNPFAASPGCGETTNCPEIYAWGLRNPWRWSFDRATGDLWAGDVGQNAWEEIDRIERGRNYGWAIREGAHCYNATSCPTAGLIDPVAEYAHENGRCSVTGGYVYRGSALPALGGHYLYGDFCSGEIWGLSPAAEPAPQLLAASGASIVSFAEDQAGELYVLDIGGRIYRLASVSAAPPAASRLSQTGCVEPAAPARPAAGLIPYGVNLSFWSDGADKERYLALPDGTRLHIGTDDDWAFPVGSVLMKHFRLGGALIETRLFVRHSDGEWAGYSYEWDEAQSDATLVVGGKTRMIGTQSWRYPSAAECLRCHSAAAGRALGPETAQMNRDFYYASTGRRANQLTTYAHIGLFDAPLAAAPDALARLPAPDDASAPPAARARAYLHANCANCHRPDGPTPVALDLRYATAEAAMNACNVAPQAGDLGVSGARLLVPGDPGRSLLALRMRALDANRMPPLASEVVDAEGVALVEAWIMALATCP